MNEEARSRQNEDVLQRLFTRVEFTESCWLWRGSVSGDGYGGIRVSGRNQRVHRVAYELLVAPVPDGLVLDHLEELLEAAAEAMCALDTDLDSIRDAYVAVVRNSSPFTWERHRAKARAALEVFRREQGARDEDLREAAIANLLRAREMVGDLCSGKQRWVMSIPARPEHDPDLVIVFGIDAALDALGHRREAAPATEEVE